MEHIEFYRGDFFENGNPPERELQKYGGFLLHRFQCGGRFRVAAVCWTAHADCSILFIQSGASLQCAGNPHIADRHCRQFFRRIYQCPHIGKNGIAGRLEFRSLISGSDVGSILLFSARNHFLGGSSGKNRSNSSFRNTGRYCSNRKTTKNQKEIVNTLSFVCEV